MDTMVDGIEMISNFFLLTKNTAVNILIAFLCVQEQELL